MLAIAVSARAVLDKPADKNTASVVKAVAALLGLPRAMVFSLTATQVLVSWLNTLLKDLFILMLLKKYTNNENKIFVTL